MGSLLLILEDEKPVIAAHSYHILARTGFSSSKMSNTQPMEVSKLKLSKPRQYANQKMALTRGQSLHHMMSRGMDYNSVALVFA